VNGSNVTEATGSADTVMVAVCVAGVACPGELAVTVSVVVPAVTPDTTPLVLTVAIAGSAVLQLIVRPVAESGVVPEKSEAETVVWPLLGTVTGEGVSTTLVTGAYVTLTVLVPAGDEPPTPAPLAVAVIVTGVPLGVGAIAVTTPLCETAAKVLSLDDQTIVRPTSGVPVPSSAVAVSVVDPPSTTDALEGVTTTEATGIAETETLAAPEMPSIVAEMVAVPTPTAVTRPLFVPTVAIVALLVDHTVVRPVSTLPIESRGVAVSCTVPPMLSDAVGGVTVTDATGTSETLTVAIPDTPSTVA